MNLPKLDISSLPDLDTLTGVFGSVSNGPQNIGDDAIVVIMVYLYEIIPPQAII